MSDLKVVGIRKMLIKRFKGNSKEMYIQSMIDQRAKKEVPWNKMSVGLAGIRELQIQGKTIAP